MSVNFNRASSKHVLDNRYYKYFTIYDSDPYWDECWGLHHTSTLSGSKKPNKSLYFYKVRMYRTWKYNRKTQYKFKK